MVRSLLRCTKNRQNCGQIIGFHVSQHGPEGL
jgi:hypothetical protein